MDSGLEELISKRMFYSYMTPLTEHRCSCDPSGFIFITALLSYSRFIEDGGSGSYFFVSTVLE
jgi:hypothetical protein